MSESKPLVLALLALIAEAGARFATPDCPDFKPEEFRYVKVVTKSLDTSLNEPLRADFDLREDGKVDIYFVERHGKVKRWNAASNTVTTLAHLDVYSDWPEERRAAVGDAEAGLNSIALDPGFRKNGHVYLFYAPFASKVFRLSRFTLKGDSLSPASEKVLLDIPEGREHGARNPIVIPGGAMVMDPHGDLWITVGANSELSPSVNEKERDLSAEASSANLADLRGSILRIHPDDSPRGYSIPKGNFGEYFAERFGKEGEASLAAEYADPKKVLPEIYVKGVRNPYSLNVDPVRGWVAWGEFGPNRFGAMRVEEDNLAKHPIYGGYPYWSGKDVFLLDGLQPWSSAKMDMRAPINNSIWNAGPKRLPAADTPLYAYSAQLNNGFIVGNHPASGPLYHYDPASPSPVKLPPHFDKAWFVTDRMSGVRVFQLDETGSFLVDSAALMTGQKLERPLDLRQGPDGALYVVDYGPGWHATSPATHIGRIEYTGSCRPGAAATSAAARRPAAPLRFRISSRKVEVDEPGPHIVRVHDFRGMEIAKLAGEGPMSHPFAPGARKGVYFVTVEMSGSGASRTLSLMNF